MFCRKCGNQLVDSASFCSGCGAAVLPTRQMAIAGIDAESATALSVSKKKPIGTWAIVAAIAIVAVMVLSGAWPKPSNLEEYCKANPDEYQELQQAATEIASSNVFLEKVVIDVKANQLSWYLVFPLQSDYLVGPTGLDWFEALGGSKFLGSIFGLGRDVEASFAKDIQDLEKALGFSGITERIVFMDSSGRELYTVTYGRNGQV